MLATLTGLEQLLTVVKPLQGALWLTSAIGWGGVLELTTGSVRMAAGARLQDLVALAQQGGPGELLVQRDAAAWLKEAVGLGAATGLEPLDNQGDWRWPRPLEQQLAPLALPRANTQAPATGDVIDDRYLLGPVLGEGGFGVVYAAQDQRTDGPVVVKLLRPGVAEDPIQVQRFFDEGRMTARLNSPYVVRVQEWGLSEDGQLFLVMERLHGRELTDLIHEFGTLDPPRAIRLGCQALAGLEQAHKLGLVHRDIKPSNLFVVSEGTAQESVKVIDFGIALDLTGRVRSLEREGSLMGTPAYMAPEQLLGTPLDGRSDLYSLALVLYEAVAGVPPFSGASPLAQALRRLEQAANPLGQASQQPLPSGLAELVDQTLAIEPQERPASAQTFADALYAILANQAEVRDWLSSWQAHRQARAPDAHWSDRTSADTLADLATLPLGIERPAQKDLP